MYFPFLNFNEISSSEGLDNRYKIHTEDNYLACVLPHSTVSVMMSLEVPSDDT